MKISCSGFLLISVLSLLFGCHKGPSPIPDPGPLRYIPEDYKSWTIFPAGSYWIYLNEKTGMTDSTLIKHGPFYHKDIYGNVPPVEFMWFYTGGPLLTRYDVEGGPNGNATLNLWMHAKTKVLSLTNKTLTDPAHSDSSTYYFNYRLIEKLDGLTLNKNHFQDVYHTRLTRQNSYYPEYNTIYDFYFAMGIGLISLKKTNNTTDTIWSLVKWNTLPALHPN